MNKIKSAIIIFMLALGLIAPVAAYADDATPSPTIVQNKGIGGFLRGHGIVSREIKETKEDTREELRETVTPAQGESLRDAIKNLLPFANVADAQVTAVNGSSITISKGGTSYTVNEISNTLFRRRFWGSSSLSEISVGDAVNVWGTWTDSSKTTINAILIRDISIQKRNGVFFGTVSSISGSSFVMATLGRGNETVTVGSSTKYLNKSDGTITFGDIKTGDRLRVRGLWDRNANTITEVVEVKDFGQVAATATPTP